MNKLLQNSTATLFKNGETGVFIFEKKNGCPIENVILFRGCSSDFRQWKNNCGDVSWESNKYEFIIAEGFLSYCIKYFGNKHTEDIYDTYYSTICQEYINSQKINDAFSFDRNLENEFYKLHIEEEKNRFRESQKLFDYLADDDKREICSLIKGYFGYITQKYSNREEKLRNPIGYTAPQYEKRM
jgi:hypothetical protein